MRIPGILEEVEPAKTFDELKVGVSFYVACFCMKFHRGMVTEVCMDNVAALHPFGFLTAVRMQVARFLPQPQRHPAPIPGMLLTIDEVCLREGKVFIVVDPGRKESDERDARDQLREIGDRIAEERNRERVRSTHSSEAPNVPLSLPGTGPRR